MARLSIYDIGDLISERSGLFKAKLKFGVRKLKIQYLRQVVILNMTLHKIKELASFHAHTHR